jgi:TPR repeat protein
MNNLGLLYDKQNKFELAEKYYLMAVEKGDLNAIYNLGSFYEIQNKFYLAEKYYLMAIENLCFR